MLVIVACQSVNRVVSEEESRSEQETRCFRAPRAAASANDDLTTCRSHAVTLHATRALSHLEPGASAPLKISRAPP